jgi:hypothetical protein
MAPKDQKEDTTIQKHILKWLWEQHVILWRVIIDEEIPDNTSKKREPEYYKIVDTLKNKTGATAQNPEFQKKSYACNPITILIGLL